MWARGGKKEGINATYETCVGFSTARPSPGAIQGNLQKHLRPGSSRKKKRQRETRTEDLEVGRNKGENECYVCADKRMYRVVASDGLMR